MKIFVIENLNNIEINENKILFEPTKDMHFIEQQENDLDSKGINHALIECRKITKKKNEFLGWTLITDSLPTSKLH